MRITKIQDLFKILADESKLKIIIHLMSGEDCVCTIAKNIGLEQSLVSHHLSKLKKAKLIIGRKSGYWVYCSLNKEMFKAMEKKYIELLGAKNISDKPKKLSNTCKN